MATKTARQSERLANEQAIVLQSGLSLEQLITHYLAPFIEAVTQQIESEDPATQETATMAAREFVGTLLADREGELGTVTDVLAQRDRLAEIYFAYGALAERIRKAVQQAELIARRHERFAECIRGSIEAWMLTSWDAKKITGHYREFRISKNPDKVQILYEDLIPAEFFDEVPATKVLNKTRLAEALKANEAVRQAAIKNDKVTSEEMDKILKETDIPGAILETNRTRLDIR